MKKARYFIFLLIIFPFMSEAQCKPVELSFLTNWLKTADNAKEAMAVKAGYDKGSPMYDAEMGSMQTYTACWVDYKDGYARFAQQITWYFKYKMMTFITLDKKNFDLLTASIKKIARHTDTAPDKTETYEDAALIYTIQVVDFNEPLQKKHPSYVIGIAPLTRR